MFFSKIHWNQKTSPLGCNHWFPPGHRVSSPMFSKKSFPNCSNLSTQNTNALNLSWRASTKLDFSPSTRNIIINSLSFTKKSSRFRIKFKSSRTSWKLVTELSIISAESVSLDSFIYRIGIIFPFSDPQNGGANHRRSSSALEAAVRAPKGGEKTAQDGGRTSSSKYAAKIC